MDIIIILASDVWSDVHRIQNMFLKIQTIHEKRFDRKNVEKKNILTILQMDDVQNVDMIKNQAKIQSI